MTKYKIVIEEPAENDLVGILSYISEILHEPNIARKIYISIKKKILSLCKLPLRHAIVNEEPYHFMQVRKLPVDNYTVFYIVDEEWKTVHILRILYNRREWQHLL